MSRSSSNRPSKMRQELEKQRRRWLVRLLLGFCLLIGVVFLGIVPQFQPASSSHQAVKVEIPKQSATATIASLLATKGVVRSAWAFRAYVRWRGHGERFKAGRYTLYSDMTLAQIMQDLSRGPNQGMAGSLAITIPEGFRLQQIAERLEEKGVCSAREFLSLATDSNFIARLPVDFPLPKASLEGYLFPDTYRFDPKTPPAEVLEAMLVNFSTRFVRPYQQEIRASGRDLHALVTAASLIEREARVPQDRARIAGVLDNRLKRDMKLDIDATVLYALGHHKEVVTYKDLKVDSPYNTYRNKGLPPGPIASPGLESLLAALRPEKHDYLYYVARPNGEHLFTRTMAEHQAAIRQARSERRQ